MLKLVAGLVAGATLLTVGTVSAFASSQGNCFGGCQKTRVCDTTNCSAQCYVDQWTWTRTACVTTRARTIWTPTTTASATTKAPTATAVDKATTATATGADTTDNSTQSRVVS